jgi:hypothetical protein
MTNTAVDPETGEIVPAPAGGGALDDYRRHLATLEPEDPEVVQERILRARLKATTADEIINAGAMTKAESLLGVELTVLSIRGADSTIADGPERYLIVEARHKDTDVEVTFATSAADVVMALTLMDMKHLFPANIRLEQAKKPTAKGFFPIFIRTVEDSF